MQRKEVVELDGGEFRIDRIEEPGIRLVEKIRVAMASMLVVKILVSPTPCHTHVCQNDVH